MAAAEDGEENLRMRSKPSTPAQLINKLRFA
ncbi:hypothetical protein COLO4_07392 [Corchorus olitorius]|uniref:Uncharacterized protein n=1 Tax=Corchorus olitorius TaxID=93759 RepID=A0A1R3KJU7_9ROSI|nr:hypothetical protein COLO4_07392 [Corchorus olitorius]